MIQVLILLNFIVSLLLPIGFCSSNTIILSRKDNILRVNSIPNQPYCTQLLIVFQEYNTNHSNDNYDNFQDFNRVRSGSLHTPQEISYLFELNSSNSSKNTVTAIFNRLVMRHFPNCIDTVIHLGHFIYPSVEQTLKTLLINRGPIFKDTERVLFVSRTFNALKSALTSPFGIKLKYKAGIVLIDESDHKAISMKEMFSECSFCRQEAMTGNRVFRLHDPHLELWKDHQRDFGGNVLRVTTPVNARPRLNYTLVSNSAASATKRYQVVNGMLMYALFYLQQRLNFTLAVKPASRGGGTGVQLPGGSWNGIMREIIDGEADLGMCTAVTASRSFVAGFSPPVIYESIVFVSGPPQKIFLIRAIFWPFTPHVWIILAFAIVSSFILSYWSLRGFRIKGWGKGRIVEYFIGCLVEECGSHPPRGVKLPFGLKMYIGLWLLCGSVITTAYLSKLVGFLTFPVMEKVPQSVEELVESKYSWGLTYFGGAAYSLIKASKTHTYEKVIRKMELSTDHIGCLRRTLNSRFICLSYDTIIQFFVNNDIDYIPGHHPLQVSSNYLLSLPVGMVYEKRSIIGPNLDESVKRFTSTGLTVEWERIDFRILRRYRIESAYKEKEKSNHLLEDDEGLLTIKHLHGAFFFLALGLIGASGLILMEVLLSRDFQRNVIYIANRLMTGILRSMDGLLEFRVTQSHMRRLERRSRSLIPYE